MMGYAIAHFFSEGEVIITSAFSKNGLCNKEINRAAKTLLYLDRYVATISTGCDMEEI